MAWMILLLLGVLQVGAKAQELDREREVVSNQQIDPGNFEEVFAF